MRKTTGLLCLVALLLAVDLGFRSSPSTDAQGPPPAVVYFGETQGSNLYLEVATQHLWLMDLPVPGRRTQPTWIDLGRFQGPGKPFAKSEAAQR